MDLRRLAAFAAVADELHFGRAAERLGVAQPAVSQAIRSLEAEIGLQLLHRTSRRTRLTAAGEELLPHARATLAAAEATREAAAALAGSGSLRIATTLGINAVLHPLLAAFRAERPDARIEVRRPLRRPKLEAVLDGDVDAAFVRTASPHPGLRFVRLASEPWRVVLAAGHPLAASDPVALAKLAPHPLVVVARGGRATLADAFVAACRKAGFEPELASPAASLDEALVAVATSGAWTLLAASNVHGAAPGIVDRALTGTELAPSEVLLAVRATGASDAAQTLARIADGSAAR